MKALADGSRKDESFNVGDMVLVKLQKYRQVSLAKRRSNKLERQYFGPYKIAERISEVAHRLESPAGAKIHNVFHVALLREYIEGESSETPKFPTDLIQFKDERVSKGDGIDTEELPHKWLRRGDAGRLLYDLMQIGTVMRRGLIASFFLFRNFISLFP